MNKKIFIIGGCSCSGKTTVSKKICEDNGFFYWRSDMIIKELETGSHNKSLDIVKRLYEKILASDADPFSKSLMMKDMYKEMANYIFEYLDSFENETVIAEGVSFLPEIAANYNVSKCNYIVLSINKENRLEIFKKRNYVKKHFSEDPMSFFSTVCYIDDMYRKECCSYGYEYYENTSIDSTYKYVLNKVLKSL